jgi:hypothetical protein
MAFSRFKDRKKMGGLEGFIAFVWEKRFHLKEKKNILSWK